MANALAAARQRTSYAIALTDYELMDYVDGQELGQTGQCVGPC